MRAVVIGLGLASSIAHADGSLRSVYAPVDTMALHHGFTGSLSLGWGYVVETQPERMDRRGTAAAVALGGWVEERVALTLRGSLVYTPDFSTQYMAGFVGPSVQLWPTDALHVDLGVGYTLHGQGCLFESTCYQSPAFDFGLAYMFGASTDVGTIGVRHRFGFELEATLGSFAVPVSGHYAMPVITGYLSYQYL